MKVKLDVIAGPHAGRRFEFDRHETFLVGRSPDAHLQLAEDPHFSRHHFLLEFNPPRCLLRNLNSRNGTLVNGQRVESCFLKDGDLISGGRTKIRFTQADQVDADPLFSGPARAARSRPADQAVTSTDTLDEHVLDFQPLPDYHILRHIGEGKMGTVYQARQTSTGLEFAVKMIAPESSASQKGVDMFLREVAVLSQLNHPRIVRLHETGTAAGLLYFVMDYVRTTNVRELLKGRSEAFRVRTYCAILVQVLEGLAHAHSLSFVHRDLKPGNILLSASRDSLHVKLADFGLAKNYTNSGLSGMTMEGELKGTCAFMPPEQVLHSRDAQPTVDIYSAGATLYYFLAHDYPHAFQSGKHPLATVLEEEPVPLANRCPRLPAGLAEIVHKALARQPADRYQTADEMRIALQPYAQVRRDTKP